MFGFLKFFKKKEVPSVKVKSHCPFCQKEHEVKVYSPDFPMGDGTAISKFLCQETGGTWREDYDKWMLDRKQTA